MPFDPRVIKDDDDFIPDDEQLEMLGAQLRDDARHLASVYPAKKADAEVAVDPPRPLRSSRAALLVIVSAACLALGLFVSLAWMRGAPEQATIVLTPNQVEVVSPTAPVPPAEPFLPVVTTPVVHQGLTGPELEAVLDLLESDAEAEQSVSL
jgi:hypothetical protein